MKKVPLHIDNNSKGQLSAEFYGNVDTPTYQQGCSYLQNAVIVPAGSVRKRPGTRLLYPALQGDQARLSSYKGRMLVSGNGFIYFLHGVDIETADRAHPPRYSASEQLVDIHPSDVVVAPYSGPYIPKDARMNALLALHYTPHPTSRAANTTPTTPNLYFVDRYDQKKDTYLHKNQPSPAPFGLAPTQTDLSQIHNHPDSTTLSSVKPAVTYPTGATVSQGEVDVVLKVPYDKHIININKSVKTHAGLMQPIEGTRTISQISITDAPPPEFFVADVIREYRILKSKIPGINKQTAQTVTSQVLTSTSTDVFVGAFDKVFASVQFQRRLVIAYQNNNKNYIAFSYLNDAANFAKPKSATDPKSPEAFNIQFDPPAADTITIMYEFRNTLIIGTAHAIYAIQNGAGNTSVDSTQPLSITKISDFGTAALTPALHTDKLYIVSNDLQSLVELNQEPWSHVIQSKRIVTYSDSLRTNGYITKLIFWKWDFQFLGILMSDGNMLKVNLDTQDVNFNQWSFDKDTIIDVEPFSSPGNEDVLYFVIDRSGEVTVEIMYNHQHIQKIEHSYACFRKRSEETEVMNQYVSTVLPHYVKHSTHSDGAITLSTRSPSPFTINITGNLLTTVTGTDYFWIQDLIIHNHNNYHILARTGTGVYTVTNSSDTDIKDVPHTELQVKRSLWYLSRYPYLANFINKDNVSICADGKSFHLSKYDDFNNTADAFYFAIDSTSPENSHLHIEDFAEEITIGFTYRFLLVTTPINSGFSPNVSRTKIIQPTQVMLRATYVLDIGVELDKLDTIRIDSHTPVIGVHWFDTSILNYNCDPGARLIFKSDHPTPVEIISINLEYAL